MTPYEQMQAELKRLSTITLPTYEGGAMPDTRTKKYSRKPDTIRDMAQIVRDVIGGVGDTVDMVGLPWTIPDYMFGARDTMSWGLGDKGKKLFDKMTGHRAAKDEKDDTYVNKATRFLASLLTGGAIGKTAVAATEAAAPHLVKGAKTLGNVFGNLDKPNVVGGIGSVLAAENLTPVLSQKLDSYEPNDVAWKRVANRALNLVTPLIGGVTANKVVPIAENAARYSARNVLDSDLYKYVKEHNIPVITADITKNLNSKLKPMTAVAGDTFFGNLTPVHGTRQAMTNKISEMMHLGDYKGRKAGRAGKVIQNEAYNLLDENASKSKELKTIAGISDEQIRALNKAYPSKKVDPNLVPNDVKVQDLTTMTQEYIKEGGNLNALKGKDGIKNLKKWYEQKNQKVKVTFETEPGSLKYDKLDILVRPNLEPNSVFAKDTISVLNDLEANRVTVSNDLAKKLKILEQHAGNVPLYEMEKFRKALNKTESGLNPEDRSRLQNAVRKDMRDHIILHNGEQAALSYDKYLKHWEDVIENRPVQEINDINKGIKRADVLDHKNKEVFDATANAILDNRQKIQTLVNKIPKSQLGLFKEQLMAKMGFDPDRKRPTFSKFVNKWKDLEVDAQNYLQKILNEGEAKPVDYNKVVDLMEGVNATLAQANHSGTSKHQYYKAFGTEIVRTLKRKGLFSFTTMAELAKNFAAMAIGNTIYAAGSGAINNTKTLHWLGEATQIKNPKNFRDFVKKGHQQGIIKLPEGIYESIMGATHRAILQHKEEEEK